LRISQITVFAVALGAIACVVTEGGQRPRVSPHETTEVVSVDGSAMSITYGRPSMRGRRIMGSLVPYGRVWCPGADEVTTITTSKGLRVGDLSLPAGRYALWMLPTADAWTLIINSDTNAFHTYHNSRTDLGQIRLQKRALSEPVEQLTFAIEKNPAGPGGAIKMRWETTEVSAPFTVVE
jgi:hypothetical protein